MIAGIGKETFHSGETFCSSEYYNSLAELLKQKRGEKSNKKAKIYPPHVLFSMRFVRF